MTLPVATRTERLNRLVGEIRAVVDRGLPPDLTAYLVAESLAPHLGADDLLLPEQCEGDPAGYRLHPLYAEPDGSFSVAALVWLPGQHTSVHDHLAWGATGVHRGEERERRYRLIPDGRCARLVATADVVSRQGEVSGFAPPGDIHRVVNSGSDTTISLHVYGADVTRLGTSIRRVYRLPVQEH